MVHRRNRGAPPAGCAGFTLVEAMVALLVLSVGVIGVAALQGQSLAASRAAIFRSQAVNQASDMADRIRTNRSAGSAYAGAASFHGCDRPDTRSGTDCTPAERAAEDLFVWNADIAATLPGGQGSVVADTTLNPATYSVTVSWDEGTGNDRASFPLTFRLQLH